MNEMQRLSYLEAMGVDNYSPRLHLPGALTSRQCVLPAMQLAVDNTATGNATIDTAASASSNVAAQGGAGQLTPAASNGAAAAMQALLGEAPAATARVAAPGAKMAVRDGASKQNIPQFSLSIIRGSEVLILDDGMTGDVNPSEYLQLLTNILYAVGAGKQRLTIDTFTWPMAKNSLIDQTETAARQALQAFLGKHIERVPGAVVLILGDTPAYYLSEQAMAKGEWFEHPLLPVQLLHSHNVCSMLSDPRIKSVVWQHLQPLYQLFHTR